MWNSPESDDREIIAYAYRPSPMGAPRAFKLVGDGIDWAAGRTSGHIAFRTIRRLRMSFKPTGMQSHRFITEVWADGVPKLKIISSSWKSMMEQERLDEACVVFVTELHRRIAAAAVPARFEQGSHPLLYWPSVVVLIGVALGLARVVALPSPHLAAALRSHGKRL